MLQYHTKYTISLLAATANLPLVPIKYSLPFAIIFLIVLTLYWFALRSNKVPRSRRRIRRANILVQTVLVPTLVYALSIPSSMSYLSKFLLSWIAVIGLLLLSVILAVFDTINSLRIHRKYNKTFQQEKQTIINKISYETTDKP